MEYKNNKNIMNKGSWMIRWRPLTLIVLTAGIGGYLIYQSWLDYVTVIIGFAAACLLFFLISLRAVANWKSKHLILAENPKEVWERARHSFLSISILEAMTLWGIGEKREFHRQYDLRMEELRKTKMEHGQEAFSSKDQVHIHRAFGSSVFVMVFLLLLILASLMWFRYREDVTEKVMASALFIVSIVLFVIQLQVVFKRNKDVLRINKHGLRLKTAFIPWSEITHIDVEAGKTLVYEERGKSKQTLDVSNLSRTAQEIDEAVLYYRHLLHAPPEDDQKALDSK